MADCILCSLLILSLLILSLLVPAMSIRLENREPMVDDLNPPELDHHRDGCHPD